MPSRRYVKFNKLCYCRYITVPTFKKREYKMKQRKAFNADYWREHFDLFYSTIEEEDLKYFNKSYMLGNLPRKAQTKNITEKKNTNFARDCNHVANEISLSCWEKFLKRVRDKRYEISSNRKRLSISEDTFDKVHELADELNCHSPDQLISHLLDSITQTQKSKIKKQAKQ